MAQSRLHELSEHGVSVWFDTLSRELLETGELERMMKEDAVVGVTSNPTIFQKALAEGDWYDAQLREVAAREADARGDLLRARGRGHQGRVRPAAPGLGAHAGRRRLRLARGRPDARLRPRRDLRAGDPAARARRSAELLREDPGDEARAGGDRGLHRPREVDQRHADLLAAALRGGCRGVPPRARAARRGRRRPRQGALRRELLRLACRHRGRQAARGRRPHRPAGQARRREREARLPSTTSRPSPARAGSSSPARARARNAASGRRRRRRTLRTRTRSTCRS